MPAKWDLILITAANNEQEALFKCQLESDIEFYSDYCVKIEVIVDESLNCGTGMATMDAAIYLKNSCKGKAMGINLLIHSGGKSTRLPHCASNGKVFARLPDGNTLLKKKLETYKHLPEILGEGVFVAASDTIELLQVLESDDILRAKGSSIILMGHLSSIEVGRNHGVYVLQPLDLSTKIHRIKTVLQKPSIEMMKKADAIDSQGRVITDSTYFLSKEVVLELAMEKEKINIEKCEVCCYGDFLLPIGAENSEYITNQKNTDPTLMQWRLMLFNLFNKYTSTTAVLVDERAVFEHYGTTTEFLENISILKDEYKNEPRGYCTDLTHVTIHPSSFLEFCEITVDTVVPKDCLLSNVHIKRKLKHPLPECSTIITLKIVDVEKYVTVILKNTDDIKNYNENLKWFGRELGFGKLYITKLFPVGETPEESLEKTLDCLNHKSELGDVSLQDAIGNADEKFILMNRLNKIKYYHP